MSKEMKKWPDKNAEWALSSGEDPAERDTDFDPKNVLPELGSVQKKILLSLRVATFEEDYIIEQDGWIPYGEIHDYLVLFGYSGSSDNSRRASISRAMRGLMERKLVAGAVTRWVRFYGMETPAAEPNDFLSFGDKPWSGYYDDRSDDPKTPRLSYVRLTANGHKAAREIEVK